MSTDTCCARFADLVRDPAALASGAAARRLALRELGRLPSGLYVLTAGRGAAATGMLASWVQQVGFEP